MPSLSLFSSTLLYINTYNSHHNECLHNLVLSILLINIRFNFCCCWCHMFLLYCSISYSDWMITMILNFVFYQKASHDLPKNADSLHSHNHIYRKKPIYYDYNIWTSTYSYKIIEKISILEANVQICNRICIMYTYIYNTVTLYDIILESYIPYTYCFFFNDWEIYAISLSNICFLCMIKWPLRRRKTMYIINTVTTTMKSSN